MLCQIAATINLYIQKKMDQYKDDREEVLMALRNQKCTVYDTRLITTEPQSKANAFYEAFNMNCPASFKRKNGKLIPETGMAQNGETQL